MSTQFNNNQELHTTPISSSKINFDERLKEEKYLAIKELLKGLSIRDAINVVEYFTIQIKKDILIG